MLLLLLAIAAAALTACHGFRLDKLDVFGLNEKKKLPGERKELFPGRRAGRDAGHSAGIHERQPTAARNRAGAGSRTSQAQPPRARQKTPRPSPSRSQSRSRNRVAKPQAGNAQPTQDHRAAAALATAAAGSRTASSSSGQSPWPAPAQDHHRRALAVVAAARHLLALTRVRRGLTRRRPRRKHMLECVFGLPATPGSDTDELHRSPLSAGPMSASRPVQPAGRPAPGAGRRPAGRDARPPRRRGPARRSRFHGDRYRRARAVGAGKPLRPHAGADRSGDRRRPMRSSS